MCITLNHCHGYGLCLPPASSGLSCMSPATLLEAPGAQSPNLSIALNLTSLAIVPHLFRHKYTRMCTHAIHITHTTFAYVPFCIFQKLLEVDTFYPSTPGLLVFSPPHREEEERSHKPWAGGKGSGGGQYSEFGSYMKINQMLQKFIPQF